MLTRAGSCRSVRPPVSAARCGYRLVPGRTGTSEQPSSNIGFDIGLDHRGRGCLSGQPGKGPAVNHNRPAAVTAIIRSGTDFRFAAGYLGRSADRRGPWRGRAADMVADADAGYAGRMAHLGLAEQAARVSLRQAGRRSAGSTSMVLCVARPGLLGAVGQDTPERVVRAAEPDQAVGGKEWPLLHRVAVDVLRNTASSPRTTAAQIRGPVLVPPSRHLEAFTAARVRQGVWGPAQVNRNDMNTGST
jgi:hypothetical protein